MSQPVDSSQHQPHITTSLPWKSASRLNTGERKPSDRKREPQREREHRAGENEGEKGDGGRDGGGYLCLFVCLLLSRCGLMAPSAELKILLSHLSSTEHTERERDRERTRLIDRKRWQEKVIKTERQRERENETEDRDKEEWRDIKEIDPKREM